MPDEIGPHLLGRVPSPEDERDYRLGDFLAGGDAYDAALAAVERSLWTSNAVKRWARMTTALVQSAMPPTPSPGPPPKPAPGPAAGDWWTPDDVILDQGDTPRCVGFTGADWEQALPIAETVTNADGDDLYEACKRIDGDAEDGTTMRSLATVLRARAELTTYAFASSLDEVITFLGSSGPVAWGIGWTDSMFTPDASGLVVPSGPDVGGHAILETRYDAATDRHWFANHWGPAWGVSGHFCMTSSDLAARLADGGEALAAVQIAA